MSGEIGFGFTREPSRFFFSDSTSTYPLWTPSLFWITVGEALVPVRASKESAAKRNEEPVIIFETWDLSTNGLKLMKSIRKMRDSKKFWSERKVLEVRKSYQSFERREEKKKETADGEKGCWWWCAPFLYLPCFPFLLITLLRSSERRTLWCNQGWRRERPKRRRFSQTPEHAPFSPLSFLLCIDGPHALF